MLPYFRPVHLGIENEAPRRLGWYYRRQLESKDGCSVTGAAFSGPDKWGVWESCWGDAPIVGV